MIEVMPIPIQTTPPLMPELPTDPAPQTFEESLVALQQIVHDLEEGNLGLEASLSHFEDGIRLLRNCYRILEQAEQKIEILTGADGAGNPVTEPFDAPATIDATEQPEKKTGRNRVRSKPESPLPTAEPEVAPREQGGLF
jgi:exodeoxyribonuclease VII small subunit